MDFILRKNLSSLFKGLLPKQNRTQRPYLVGDFPKKNISGGPNKKNSY